MERLAGLATNTRTQVVNLGKHGQSLQLRPEEISYGKSGSNDDEIFFHGLGCGWRSNGVRILVSGKGNASRQTQDEQTCQH